MSLSIHRFAIYITYQKIREAESSRQIHDNYCKKLNKEAASVLAYERVTLSWRKRTYRLLLRSRGVDVHVFLTPALPVTSLGAGLRASWFETFLLQTWQSILWMQICAQLLYRRSILFDIKAIIYRFHFPFADNLWTGILLIGRQDVEQPTRRIECRKIMRF